MGSCVVSAQRAHAFLEQRCGRLGGRHRRADRDVDMRAEPSRQAQRLAPLPSVDPQRFLVARPQLVASLRAAFAGQPGLEAVYGDEAGAGGELGEILAAGYPRAFGILGAHRFHHSPNDDMRCVDVGHVASTGRALLSGVQALLA